MSTTKQAVSIAKDQYILRGKLLQSDSGVGIGRLKVIAWDHDAVGKHDQLGEGITNSSGEFEIRFSRKQFSESFFDRKPDLFFEIFDGVELLKTTVEEVLKNVTETTPTIVIFLSQPKTIAIMANSINWNAGQLITLGVGDTATCKGGLNTGQLYGLFFYNAAGNDASTTVNVVWSNSNPPVQVTVPGTTMNQGLAAICFVDGSQTNTVSAAVTHGNTGAQLQAFICSVKMPLDTTGINNIPLPLDGNQHPFNKFTRYFAVPASHWYSAQIESDVDQFICVQFQEYRANVYIVNSTVDPSNVIAYAGDAVNLVTVNAANTQSIAFNLQGNGQQFVWMNADSIQNSQDATIAVQSLSDVFASL